jgi:hypothetical protein
VKSRPTHTTLLGVYAATGPTRIRKCRGEQQRELATLRSTDDRNTPVPGDDVRPAKKPTNATLECAPRESPPSSLGCHAFPVRYGQTSETLRHAQVQEVLGCSAVRATERQYPGEWALPSGVRNVPTRSLSWKSDLHLISLLRRFRRAQSRNNGTRSMCRRDTKARTQSSDREGVGRRTNRRRRSPPHSDLRRIVRLQRSQHTLPVAQSKGHCDG